MVNFYYKKGLASLTCRNWPLLPDQPQSRRWRMSGGRTETDASSVGRISAFPPDVDYLNTDLTFHHCKKLEKEIL